jgi:hypothetical protein
LLLKKLYPDSKLGLYAVAAIAAVGVVQWTSTTSLHKHREKIGILLSVLAATVIFGYGKTQGLIVGGLGALLLAVALELNLRVIYPFVGLGLYRIAKRVITDQGGYELANHYLLSGIVAGLILVYVLADWFDEEKPSWRNAGWLLALTPVAILIQLGLDIRGLVGWLLGSAIGVALIPSSPSSKLASALLPLSAALLLLIPRILEDVSVSSRPDRLSQGLMWLIPIAIGVGMLWAPAKRNAEVTT